MSSTLFTIQIRYLKERKTFNSKQKDSKYSENSSMVTIENKNNSNKNESKEMKKS